jgi:hypothetical protein
MLVHNKHLLFNVHGMNIKVIGSDSMSEMYDLKLKLFMPKVQNLNMTDFEMCVVVIEFEVTKCVFIASGS